MVNYYKKMEDAVRAFFRCQSWYEEDGGTHPDVDRCFNRCLMETKYGKITRKRDLPNDVDTWGLYHTVGSGAAMAELRDAAWEVCRLIRDWMKVDALGTCNYVNNLSNELEGVRD